MTEVAENTAAAATRDDRFAPIAPEELEETEIEISILGSPRPLAAASERDVLSRLRPGVDGVILEAPGARATFLPSVWAQVPKPRGLPGGT